MVFLLPHFSFFQKEKCVYYTTLNPGRKAWVQCITSFFCFYGQAVRPGLIALRAVKPEVHTPQAVRPEVYTGPARKGWTSFVDSGRKA